MILVLMNSKTFAKLLVRDVSCVHCGSLDATLIPHHRANRGMGGSKERDTPSNILLLCAEANTRLESDWRFASFGRKMGWKVSTFGDPKLQPVYHAGLDQWRVLDDAWGFIRVYGYDAKIEAGQPKD